MTDRRLWAGAAALISLLLVLHALGFRVPSPTTPLIPVADAISVIMAWFTSHFRSAFRAITWIFAWPLGWLRQSLQWLPWPVVVLLGTGIGFLAAGWRLGLFTALSLIYIVFTGYWPMTAA